MTGQPASARTLAGYGLLGVPLAFAGLPIYVHIPHYYAQTYGMGLGLLGALILAARLFDAVQDPLIGYLSDRFAHRRRALLLWPVPLLAIAYALLFAPPQDATQTVLSIWLVAGLVVVYTAFSVLSINYYALGMALGEGYHGHTRVAMFRESAVLGGVLLAAVLPGVLTHASGDDARQGFVWFSLIFAILLLLGCVPSLKIAGRIARLPSAPHEPVHLKACFADASARWLYGLFLLNALPTAMTGTLFLFFAADVLQAEDRSGPLLALYFVAAAVSVPLWSRLSRNIGKRHTLLAGTVLAIGSFVWAYGVGAGEVGAFALICILSGAAMGSDVAMLPSMLADIADRKPHLRASYISIWNGLTKLTLALGAGLTLPLLAVYGYHPNQPNDAGALAALAFAYTLLPCLLKLAAVAMLWFSPLDQRRMP